MSPEDAEVLSVEGRLRQAMLERNLDELDRIVADDAFFTGPDGTTLDKGQDLDLHRSGRLLVHAFDVREIAVRTVAPKTAEVDLVALLRVEIDGAAHEGTYRYHRVYAKRAGGWQVVFARADAK